MIWLYKIALRLPGRRQWGIEKLVASESRSAVAPLLRIMEKERGSGLSPRICVVVEALAEGRLRDRRLGEELLAICHAEAVKHPQGFAEYAAISMETLAAAIVATCDESLHSAVAAMATDRNPSKRELAVKTLRLGRWVEGLKPILAVAGSICRNGQWDDVAFDTLQAIVKQHGVLPLRTALESLMRELDAGTFHGCMDVAARLLPDHPSSTDALELAGDLPLDEVSGRFCHALGAPDQAIRVRAAEILLARVSISGEALTVLQQAKEGIVPAADALARLKRTLDDYRGQADTMLEKEYKRANTRLKPLPWRHVVGDEAVRIARQGGVTFSESATCVLLIAPAGTVHEGDIECEGRLNGSTFRQTCDGAVTSSGGTVTAAGHKYMTMTSPFSAYLDKKRTTMVALVFIPLDGAESPRVLIDKIVTH